MAFHTPIGLLSFPHLFTARPPAPGAEPRFSCTLIFDATAQKDPLFRALKMAMAAAIDAEWGPGKSRDTVFMGRVRNPFRPTSEKDYAGYKEIEGGVFISAWSKTKPGVVDARLQDITVPSDVWPGQHARASVQPFCYDVSGNRGVSFGLNNLQICRTDGPRLDGRKAARDEFGTYGDAEMADADEPPF